MASKVFLHVGAPLAPATTMRDALARHRRRLARAGVFYPPSHLGHDGGHRDAVLDALDLAADQAARQGAWDRLAECVRDWRRGTAVVSHELLAGATPSQVDRIVTSLGSAEVHVVYVAQDLGRQLPRAWQQWVYGGGTAPFASYAAHVARRDPHRASRVFWRAHDLDDVLSRWATRVPADRIHVVTAARGDGAGGETWERFGETLGVDPHRFKLGRPAEDRLGSLAGTEVVRLLNAAGHGQDAPDEGRLRAVVSKAQEVTGPVPRLPHDLREAVTAEADRTTALLASKGWRLVGSPEDLLTREDAFATDPTQVRPSAEQLVRAHTAVLLSLCAKDAPARGPAGMRRRALRVLRDRVTP
ncbi:MAG TPA: hypothetical protein VK204_05430 [Nocardioidaceae bacterium]|nr:hypothetical protein [Nocardioidaceae bacterium]